MSYQLTAWAVKQQTGSSTRKAVLMALANAASHHTGRCEPHIDVLAEETELNERTVRRALDDLTAAGFIAREMQHKANGHRAGYVYTFPRLADSPPGSADGLPDSPPTELPDPAPGQDLEPQEDLEQVDLSSLPSSGRERVVGVQHVCSAWEAHAPPLVQHRDAFYADRKTFGVVERKLRTYPAAVIAEAIANYATVLAGDEWMWTHSWTLTDFLNRGLDRFVSEARPLENFKRGGTKFGRRDVSAREFSDLADRLEADQRREIESGTG